MIAFLLAYACVGELTVSTSDLSPKVIVTQPDESRFPEITVYFEVRRPDGTSIRDADRREFRVSEDGRDRPILGFDSPITVTTKPTTIVLVLDRSGSMEQDDKINSLKKAVGSFIGGLPAGSRVAVIAFGSEVEPACAFTTDKGQMLRAVEAIEPSGVTRYFDAVATALKWLEGESGRRAVLAMTDGLDTDSKTPIDAVIQSSIRLGVPVHTLGLGEGGAIDSASLERLARETRGQSYRARDAESLKAIYQELAERLGSTYSLVYQTDRKVPDGTLRPIKVYYAESQGAGETTVFIRGMVVPSPGWSRLFLLLVCGLGGLIFLPTFLNRQGKSSISGTQSVE